MKRCRICSEEKPLAEFYRHSKMANSFSGECKKCTCARMRRYRQNNESVREYDRIRGRNAKRKLQKAKQLVTYREQNEAAYKAHNALNRAVRDGKITKEPCVKCGESKVHGHHSDYAEPLSVIWLCAKCHARHHALEKARCLSSPMTM